MVRHGMLFRAILTMNLVCTGRARSGAECSEAQEIGERPARCALSLFLIDGNKRIHPDVIERPPRITYSEDQAMNWDRVQGNWKQFSGKVKEKWGQLTDDDLTQINGNREQLEGKIQARYGYAKDKVKSDVDTWVNGLQ